MKKLSLFIVMIAYCGLNQSIAQWNTIGNNIYNTNTGNVGIGNSSPTTLLHVKKNMTEPTIAVQNLGGIGGATFTMIDDASGANWKFKATLNGGFKIRDHANELDVIVIEPNSAANVICISGAGNVGIGTPIPPAGYKLYVHSGTGTAIRAAATSTTATTYAVSGYQNSTSGAAGRFISENGDGASAGVVGIANGTDYPNSCGVVGHHIQGGAGVGAWSNSGNLFRGYSGDYPGGTLRFYVNNTGQVFADGGFNTFKKVLSSKGTEEYRTFNSIQATESRIEDIGSSALLNGHAAVSIDPIFAQAVNLKDGYQVFLTPVYEEIVCLVVTNKSAEKFIVKGSTLDGTPVSCNFDYRIVAKDTESPDIRMEVIDIPKPVNVPKEDSMHDVWLDE